MRRLSLLLSATPLIIACGDGGVVAPTAQFRGEVVTEPDVAVIYSNFGPGMVYDPQPEHGWTINGFVGAGFGQQGISHRFTPSTDYAFSDVQVALFSLRGPAPIRVFVQADANGLPGGVIEGMAATIAGSAPAVYTASSVLFPLLPAGTPYWLSVVAGADAVLVGWSWNSRGDVSREAFATTQGGSPTGPWGLNPTPLTRGVFQVQGAPTPQGATRLLIGRVATLRAAGLLHQGQAESLLEKLAAALESEDRGSAGACRQLQAFINQVNALIRSDQMSEETGQPLAVSAGSVRSLIGCGA